MGLSSAPAMLNTVSTTNSSAVPLAGGATFTGGAESNNLRDLLISMRADQDGILYVDLSTDGGQNWDSTITFPVSANINEVHTIVKGSRAFRIRYVNGSVAQTFMRLHTEYGDFRQLTSPLNQAVQQDADASTVRSISEETGIAAGLFTGFSIVNKFGRNPDIDTATVPEDIWATGGVYTGFPDSTVETIEVLSDSANDAAAGTGARTVSLVGLDTNYNSITEVVTLNGTTPVATVNQFRRMHSMTVITAGSSGVNAGTITARHSTTEANVFATIQPGFNQSYASAYTVPAGYTAYLRRVSINIRGAVTVVAADGFLWIRAFGGVFRARRPFSANNAAPVRDEIYGGVVLTEKSDIVLRIQTVSANNLDVTGGYDLVLVKN